MNKFKSKLKDVEALEWTGHNEEAMRQFLHPSQLNRDDRTLELLIKSQSGGGRALPGSFIMKTDNGGFQIVTADAMSRDYEPAL